MRIFFLDKLFHWIDQASGNDLFVYKTERRVASKVKVSLNNKYYSDLNFLNSDVILVIGISVLH